MSTRRGPIGRGTASRAALVALAAVTASAGALLGAADAAQASSRVPGCTAGMLRIADAGSQGAAGTVYHLLRFTDVTHRSCSLTGYPGVSFTDAHGRQLGVPAAWTAGVPVTRIVLRPGASAHTALGIPQAANFPPASCQARTSSFLRVYPPGSFTARLVPLTALVCTTAAGRAHVQALAAGPGTP